MENKPELSKEISGIKIDGKDYNFVGIPSQAFIDPPSPFGDMREVNLYIIEKIEHPPEGGFYSYRKNHKFPVKGIVFPEGLERVNVSKRYLRNHPKYLLKTWYTLWPILIPFLRKHFIWTQAEEFAEFSWHFTRHIYVKPEWHCNCVREIYRTCGLVFNRDDVKTDKRMWIIDKIIMAIGMILEFDDSYRYRFQDMFGELNKENFMKSPSKELVRLFGILEARGKNEECNDTVADRMKPILLAMKVMFFLFPLWKKKAKLFVKVLDLEKIKLDEADRYHCMVRPDYRYMGIPFKERFEKRKEIDKEEFDTRMYKHLEDEQV